MKIGIEHEFVFKDSSDNYLDFTNSSYKMFKQIVDKFPVYEEDKILFECKSLETVPKRLYVEGFERYDSNGILLETLPKGLEIRTPPYEDINELLENFTSSFKNMTDITSSFGLFPLLAGYSPFRDTNSAQKYLKNENWGKRNEKELNIAKNSLLAHGMHISISFANNMDLKDTLEKLNFYLPYIVPFSFSTPFCNNNLFEGLCYRNYIRARNRQLVSIRKKNNVDVVEFRGFDAVGDSKLLKSVLYLFKSLVNESKLKGRAKQQNAKLIELSSLKGFENKIIKDGALMILDAIKTSLGSNSNQLDYLYHIVQTNESYAAKMKREFSKTNDIIQSMSNMYNFSEDNVLVKSV